MWYDFVTVDQKIVSSVLDIFQEHYPKLIRALPMNDEYFIAEVYAKKLLPGNLKADIESLPASAKRASKFLDKVINHQLKIMTVQTMFLCLHLLWATTHGFWQSVSSCSCPDDLGESPVIPGPSA